LPRPVSTSGVRLRGPDLAERRILHGAVAAREGTEDSSRLRGPFFVSEWHSAQAPMVAMYAPACTASFLSGGATSCAGRVHLHADLREEDTRHQAELVRHARLRLLERRATLRR